MALDFLSLYNECAGQPWSMFDGDAESIDDLETSLKMSINKAASYLWNYYNWSFRYVETSFRTKLNKRSYNMPNGIITREVIDGTTRYGLRYNGKPLTYIEDYMSLDDKTGEPEAFWIKGEQIHLYPIPDSNSYTISMEYLLLPYALNEEDEQIYELTEEEDRLNIPEKYEKIFRNCLISLAMIYAIADESDENHSGYQKQYEDALAILFKYCKDKIVDRRIII